jgi:hypothetical protein
MLASRFDQSTPPLLIPPPHTGIKIHHHPINQYYDICNILLILLYTMVFNVNPPGSALEYMYVIRVHLVNHWMCLIVFLWLKK